MSIKKIAVVFLSVALLFLSACGNPDTVSSVSNKEQGSSDQTAPLETLQLLYCESDTMNPYKTVNKANAEIGLLLFEPLVKVHNDFSVEFALADSVEILDKKCTVVLKNASFSDSSKIKSSDVVFSYNLALESERFSYLFYNVEKVAAEGDSTVVFTLKKQDPFFASLLTFPILKEGSDELKNEDNLELSPIGSGRFVQQKDNPSRLIPNNYYYGEKTNIESITLINAPDSESMEHYVKIGATDIYYTTLPDNTVIRMSGNKNSLNLNNMVFLGVNHNYGALSDETLRFALSSAIDRSELVRLAFYGEAKAATGFFHPDWKETSGYQSILDTSNSKIVIENLEEIGYNKLDKDGYRINKSGSRLVFEILVNKDSSSKVAVANEIASQLSEFGIKINIRTVSREEYLSRLQNGNFQLYIGEVKILPNMDISSLVLPDGATAYGIGKSPATENSSSEALDSSEDGALTDALSDNTDYRTIMSNFYEGKNTIADVAVSLLSSMPLIPLAYRNSLVFYSDTLSDIGQASPYDIFISINNYTYN